MPELTVERAIRAAEFRAALRDFLSQSERACRAWNLTTQRYLLLLFVKGARDGEGRPTMSELRERLKVSPNTVTDLVSRAEAAGLVAREPGAKDLRFVHVTLTEQGEQLLAGAFVDTEDSRRELAHGFELLTEAFRVANKQ